MRKKPQPAEPPVVSQEILERARRASETDKLRRVVKCVVCASECSENSSEQLCWVCRRLKISAWRDTDIQMTAQE
jgi:hypothetical protein